MLYYIVYHLEQGGCFITYSRYITRYKRLLKTVVDSVRPSASTVISGARSDIGPDMVRLSLLSLFPVAVTGPQPSGPTGRARTRL